MTFDELPEPFAMLCAATIRRLWRKFFYRMADTKSSEAKRNLAMILQQIENRKARQDEDATS